MAARWFYLWAPVLLSPLGWLATSSMARADAGRAQPAAPNMTQFDSLLTQHDPWQGFEDDDSVLTVTHIQRVAAADCRPWIQALMDTIPGDAIGDEPLAPDPWARAWRTWAPWSKSDLEAVKECDGFPCAVKLAESETTAMAAATEDDRMKRFEKIVMDRVGRFQKSGPEAYEFPGVPADPWAVFEKKNFTTPLARPQAALLRASRFNLDPDRMKTLHQILDVRTARAGNEGVVWDRAAYSDHYFDAWGEWRDVRCQSGHGAIVVLVLVVDFDLLKEHDIISLLAHGRMRNVIRDNGSRYLTSVFTELQRVAGIQK